MSVKRPNKAEYTATVLLRESPGSVGELDESDCFCENPSPSLDEEITSILIAPEINQESASANNQRRSLNFLLKNLLPDNGITIKGYPLVEGSFTIKLMKFIFLTFGSIALVHWIVSKTYSDRDVNLQLRDIWIFEGNLIIGDCVTFFLVGRMWRQRGIDHLAWILPIVLCNVYFESQNYFAWLQHHLSLYDMHCLWPWQLWLFFLILIPVNGLIFVCYFIRGYQERVLLMKLVEICMCTFFFLLPSAPSQYFHFHHWFAGWFCGMHFNFDVWWCRAIMAYYWGMYINGIAVYGRDPILTCEYGYFLSIGNSCPYLSYYTENLKNQTNTTHQFAEMVPVDWRNCSDYGYQP